MSKIQDKKSNSKVSSQASEKTRSGRQSEETSEQTKLAIIKAATVEFAKHGFEGSSLRNIAKRAGTTHGLIRHHFGSKDDVFYAVVDYSLGVFGKGELQIISELSPEDFQKPDVLIATHKKIMHNIAKISAENPEMMRILMHEGSEKSERLDYLFQQIDVLNEMHCSFFETVQKFGMLSNWTADSCFLFIITNLGLVFGLSAVSSYYSEADILSDEQVELQTERIFNMIYGQTNF